jgi:hypothetical protein
VRQGKETGIKRQKGREIVTQGIRVRRQRVGTGLERQRVGRGIKRQEWTKGR